jgi:undecaprenyl-diphosphatase
VNPTDVAVFRAVNRWPEDLAPFFVFMSEATKQPSVRVALLALFVALLAWRASRTPAWLAMLAWPLANGITDFLKAPGGQARPSWPVARLVEQGVPLDQARAALTDVIVRVFPLGSPGTASAHSANMAAIAAVFLAFHRPLGFAWALVALATGLSRVYVGVHYPSQVLLGWGCGAFAGFVVVQTYRAWRRLSERRVAPAEDRAGPDDRTTPQADPGSQT